MHGIESHWKNSIALIQENCRKIYVFEYVPLDNTDGISILTRINGNALINATHCCHIHFIFNYDTLAKSKF